MRRLLLPLFFVFVVLVSSCSNSVNNGGTIGPGGNVTFAMSGEVDPNNNANYIFAFKPSVDVKITTLIIALPSQPLFDTIQSGNPTYSFSKDTTYFLDGYPYMGVTHGQQWTFKFTGNTVSGNTAYTTTANYTIP